MIELKTLLKLANAVAPISDMGKCVGAKWEKQKDGVFLISPMNKPVQFDLDSLEIKVLTTSFIARKLLEKLSDDCYIEIYASKNADFLKYLAMDDEFGLVKIAMELI